MGNSESDTVKPKTETTPIKPILKKTPVVRSVNDYNYQYPTNYTPANGYNYQYPNGYIPVNGHTYQYPNGYAPVPYGYPQYPANYPVVSGENYLNSEWYPQTQSKDEELERRASTHPHRVHYSDHENHEQYPDHTNHHYHHHHSDHTNHHHSPHSHHTHYHPSRISSPPPPVTRKPSSSMEVENSLSSTPVPYKNMSSPRAATADDFERAPPIETNYIPKSPDNTSIHSYGPGTLPIVQRTSSRSTMPGNRWYDHDYDKRVSPLVIKYV